MVKITCPGCGKSYDVTNLPPGRRLRCGKCNTHIERPADAPVATESEPSKEQKKKKKDIELPPEALETTRKIVRTRMIKQAEIPATTIKMTNEELRERYQDRKKR
ncbi:MAG: hypothetical protein HY720_10175 [Planctomycetes bacterium]|nr:hypothetical protein [Planctomycetota bacterium]